MVTSHASVLSNSGSLVAVMLENEQAATYGVSALVSLVAVGCEHQLSKQNNAVLHCIKLFLVLGPYLQKLCMSFI